MKKDDKPNFALGDVVREEYFQQSFIIKKYCGAELYYIREEKGKEFYSYSYGNVINTNEIRLEKKQSKYAKIYDECIENLSMNCWEQ